MTDQIPADKVGKIAEKMRDHAADRYVADVERRNIMVFADQLAALLSARPLPTLEDMTEEERDACTGMQADAEIGERVIIIDGTARPDGRVEVLHGEIYVCYPLATEITPRPDLPRWEWPGNKKPVPAPALPDGWRLADHQKYGRVLVVRIFGDKAIYATPHEMLGIHTHVSLVSDLTFVDQEDNTPTGPNTLAVGSEWDDVDALARACDESGRDQITVADKDGDVFVWGADAGWWETGLPGCDYAPHTIIHTGKKAH